MNLDRLENALNYSSGKLNDVSVRSNILALEEQLKEMPQVDIPVIHRYSGGIYARQVTIPAGVALTGRIYKDDHFDVMVSGEVVVTTEGEGSKTLSGFNIFESKRRKKRAGYAVTDTLWLTFHIAPEMEDDDYVDYIAFETFDEYDRFLLSDESVSKGAVVNDKEIKEAFTSLSSYREKDFEIFKIGYLAGRRNI